MRTNVRLPFRLHVTPTLISIIELIDIRWAGSRCVVNFRRTETYIATQRDRAVRSNLSLAINKFYY